MAIPKTSRVVVRVTNGTLLLFPAYLPHSIDVNFSEGEHHDTLQADVRVVDGEPEQTPLVTER